MFRKQRSSQKPEQDYFPPAWDLKAAYAWRARFWQRAFAATVVLFIVFIGFREWTIQSELLSRPYFFVPGLCEFQKAYIGEIPDEFALQFSREFVKNLATFHYSEPDIFRDASRYMAPELRANFEAQVHARMPLWVSRKVVQYLHLDNIKITEKKGAPGEQDATFTVLAEGRITKFVDGKLSTEEQDVIEIQFQQTYVDLKKPWHFQVTNLRRSYRETL